MSENNENQTNFNPDLAQSPDQTSDVTFDYNQLYTPNTAESVMQPEAKVEEIGEIIETPIVLGVPAPVEEKQLVTDIIPAFDANALEELPDDLKKNPDEPLINTVNKATQQENDQFKRNLIFLAAFFGALIIAVVFIFPMIVSK